MPLNADTLLDRIRLKAQVTRWRLIALAALVFAAVVWFEQFSDISPVEGDYIARVTIDDIIVDDPKMEDLLATMMDNDHVQAVVVRIDSPGGTTVGGEQLYHSLRKISENKPVVAVMRTMATSAAYLTALGADRIFASRGTITGSIGVIVQMAEVTELAEKLGIKPITVKSGPLKATPSPFEKFDDQQRQATESVVKDFFEYFVSLVAERRKLDRAVVEKLADGRIFTGQQALQAKLIDEIGGEDEALDWLEKNKDVDTSLELKDVQPKREKPSIFESMSEMARINIFSHFTQKLDGLIAIWQAKIL